MVETSIAMASRMLIGSPSFFDGRQCNAIYWNKDCLSIARGSCGQQASSFAVYC